MSINRPKVPDKRCVKCDVCYLDEMTKTELIELFKRYFAQSLSRPGVLQQLAYEVRFDKLWNDYLKASEAIPHEARFKTASGLDDYLNASRASEQAYHKWDKFVKTYGGLSCTP